MKSQMYSHTFPQKGKTFVKRQLPKQWHLNAKWHPKKALGKQHMLVGS